MDPTTQDVGSYYGTTDVGTDLYVGSGGSFTDENGIPLAVPSGTDINLANGNTLTYGGGAAPSPTPPVGAGNVVQTQGGSNFAGLGDVFNAVGTSIGAVVKALNPQKPTTLPGTVGAYVYNPQTGQYVPAVQGTSAVSTSSLVLVLGIGLILVLALRLGK